MHLEAPLFLNPNPSFLLPTDSISVFSIAPIPSSPSSNTAHKNPLNRDSGGLKIFLLEERMAVAMASIGTKIGLYSSLRGMEKQPISRGAAFTSLFCQDSVQVSCIVSKKGLPSSGSTFIQKASSAAAVEDGSSQDTDAVPTPIVIIDQDSDLDATIVEVAFGDRLGALLDTMNALKNLGLNVVKANVFLDSSGKPNRFAITRASTGRKVDDPELLEAIRLTIINNLIEYHPESSAQLALGAAFGGMPRSEPLDVDVATHVHVYDDGPNQSLLCVEATDHPGLLVDLVKIITDVNISVNSGEFDTEGLIAKAKFHVDYKGKALIKPLQQVLENSLRYYLRKPTTEDPSF